MEKLKPCPFCGGEAEITQTGRLKLYLRCKSCRIGLQQKVLRKSLEWLENEMIKDWNKRM